MTSSDLASSYMTKARVRLDVLQLLHQRSAYSDVMREAQEVVELATKAMLRRTGIDPPKWHDVGSIILDHLDRFPAEVQNVLPDVAARSKALRRERELSFYGDIDFVPTESYSIDDSLRAIEDARFVVKIAGVVVDQQST